MRSYYYLIKPASSLCNMSCRYCFYYDVSHNREIISNGIMEEHTAHELIDKALARDENGDITFMFQGGEPTVAGIAYFYDFINYVSSHKKPGQNINYSLQTNGYGINESWCKLFRDYNFLIGISLDGYAKNHNYFRKNKKGDNTFDKIMEHIKLLEDCQIPYNILTVLTSDLARHPKELYRFYKDNKYQYVQIIPCLPGLKEMKNAYSLTPRKFASFYKEFYDLWLDDYQKGEYLSVTLFDNIIPMFAGIPPQQCGFLGRCSLQSVIESDGTVYPCDFYVLDQYQCGNIVTNSMEEISNSEAAKNFLGEPRKPCNACKSCGFYHMCFGQCKRLASVYYDHSYCGYRDFLEYAAPSMQKIAEGLV